MLGRLHTGAHALLGAAMIAMAWPAAPGWLGLAASAPVAVWFLGTAALRRRPADVHHAVMAAAMVWMGAMPLGPAQCHGGTGPVAGAAASYFLLAAAPFLTAPFLTAPFLTAPFITAPLRIRPRGSALGSLGHAAMSLAMAIMLTATQ